MQKKKQSQPQVRSKNVGTMILGYFFLLNPMEPDDQPSIQVNAWRFHLDVGLQIFIFGKRLFYQNIHLWSLDEFFNLDFQKLHRTGRLVPARPGRWDISAKRKSSLAQAQAPWPSANIAQVVRKKGFVISDASTKRKRTPKIADLC